MCGFVGMVGPGLPAEAIRAAGLKLQHRGPDEAGFHQSPSGRFAVAHRRLAIIDLAAGHQPMSTEDGHATIAFNGEIYNFVELRSELEVLGHRFRTRSDTEVLLRGCVEWGLHLLPRLNGDFAFAYWSEPSRTLWLARDPFGVKPLYYYWDGALFAFASEPDALRSLPGVHFNLRPEAIAEYLGLGFIPAPGTSWQRVFKLPPASRLELRDNTLSVQRYRDFTPRPDARAPSFEEATERFRELLAQSVKRRLMSDVPLGVFLSGGLDSSAMTALVSEAGPRVRTFSIGFDERDFDELSKARAIAHRFGTDHHEEIVRPDAVSVLETIVVRLGEPLADPAVLPTYYLSRMTRKSVTVALSGDGGDELLGGYRRHQSFAIRQQLRRVPRLLRRGPLAALGAMRHIGEARWARTARRLLEDVDVDPLQWYRRRCWLFEPDEIDRLVANGHGGSTDSAFDDVLADRDAAASFRDSIILLDLNLGLAGGMLVKVDRMSMAHSLEVRVPFLDTSVADFIATLPSSHRIRGLRRKAMLVRGFRDTLPAGIRLQRKRGFALPHGLWFRTTLASWLRDLLLGANCALGDHVRLDEVRRRLDLHQSGREDHADGLWALGILALWLEAERATPARLGTER